MRKLAASAVLGLLAVPALASAGSSTATAERMCRAEREAMGTATFKATWGTNSNRSNAFGKCVSKTARLAHANHSNAASDCRAERDDANFAASHDGKTFEQFYGTNNSGNNAYGKCVSQKAKAANQETVEATENAAKTCKRERRADPEAFKQKYGTNHNKRNAFGKCVSRTAKEQQSEPQPESTS